MVMDMRDLTSCISLVTSTRASPLEFFGKTKIKICPLQGYHPLCLADFSPNFQMADRHIKKLAFTAH